MDKQERYSRQSDIIPMDLLDEQEITIVGVGSVGRNVALQLSSMGVSKLHLIDFDIVEESNVASQGYWEGDIGKYKVEATANHCLSINGTIQMRVDKDRFRKKLKMGDIVFSCVDSMKARELIFDSVLGKCKLFIDGRMAGEIFRVLSVWNKDSAEYYKTTLFPDSEAQTGRCTAKSTIYCASGIACFETAVLAKWLRGDDLSKDVLINLISNEMEVVA